MSPTDSAPDRAGQSRRHLAIAAGAALLACGLTAFFVARTARGPHPGSGPAPSIGIEVFREGSANPPPLPLAAGATLPAQASLFARVTAPKPTRVSLVHINVGHGMEPVVMNVAVPAGTTTILDGSAVAHLRLDGLSGPQQFAAIAADRDLTVDEALSAGRGLVPEGVGIATYSFNVGP